MVDDRYIKELFDRVIRFLSVIGRLCFVGTLVEEIEIINGGDDTRNP